MLKEIKDQIIKDLEIISTWDTACVSGNGTLEHTVSKIYTMPHLSKNPFRVTMHKSKLVDGEEINMKPHASASHVHILSGEFAMHGYVAPSIFSDPSPDKHKMFAIKLIPNTSYVLENPSVWTRDVPLGECFFIRINGEKYTQPHSGVNESLKGATLRVLTYPEKTELNFVFRHLLSVM